MFDAIFQSTTVPVLEQVVMFNEARHELLAGNIANIDTPGYRTRDLNEGEFREELREAIRRRHSPPGPMHVKMPFNNSNEPQGVAERNITSRSKTILRHDEDNVGVEQQVSEMMKNHLEFNVALNLMTQQFRILQTAISERL